jgi:hypothetical protein
VLALIDKLVGAERVAASLLADGTGHTDTIKALRCCRLPVLRPGLPAT